MNALTDGQQTAKKWLEGYREVRGRIDSINDSRERLHDVMLGCGAFDGEMRSKGFTLSDALTEQIQMLGELDSRMATELAEYSERERGMMEALSCIRSQAQRTIIEGVYIDGYTIGEMAREVGCSYDNARQLHAAGLEALWEGYGRRML